MTICVICNNDFQGLGANPDPVSLFGECCKTCDETKVVPARVLEQHYKEKYGERSGRMCITNLIHLGIKPQRTIELISKADKLKDVDLINERNYYGDLCKS